jgi:outer membrane lipoprotein-sorting protein
MKKFKLIFCALIASLLAVTAVQAAEKLQQPKVEYSADTYFETEQMSFNGRVYHALGGKDRQEMNMEGTSQIMIVRMDKQLAWILMPDSKMYMETDLKTGKKDNREITDCDIDQKLSGPETVNGIKATKSSVSMSCPDGTQYAGDMWTTKDGIMVKMVATGKTKGSKTVRIKTEIRNLKIGKQDPSLFEVPAGYTKMSMGGMMKGLGSPDTKKKSTGNAAKQESGMDSTAQQRTGRDDTSQQRETPADNVDNSLKKVRGLFGF